MYFVHFLEAPSICRREDDARITIRARISIYSPLHKAFCSAEEVEGISVVAALFSQYDDSTPYVSETYRMRRDTSVLDVGLDLGDVAVVWPVRMKVGTEDRSIDRLTSILVSNRLKISRDSCIYTAWSHWLDPSTAMKACPWVERRFMLSNDRALNLWEGLEDFPSQTLRSAGVVILTYLDRIVSLKQSTIPELERGLASASFSKLHVIDVASGCGIAGIGIAQLIPDCHVVLVDVPSFSAIINMNIKTMSPAIMSTAKFEHFPLSEDASPLKIARSTDLILVNDFMDDRPSTDLLGKFLSSLLQQSRKAVIVIVTELLRSKVSSVATVVVQAGIPFCERILLPTPEKPGAAGQMSTALFALDVYARKTN